jgi:hypothetical protein
MCTANLAHKKATNRDKKRVKEQKILKKVKKVRKQFNKPEPTILKL